MTITATYSCENAVVLITGAGSGIGAALAAHCARLGARVIAVDIDHGGLKGLIDGDPSGENVDCHTIDVSDQAQVAGLFEGLRQNYKTLDAAVLGAAIQERTDLDRQSEEAWQRIIDVNLKGVFVCLKHAVPWFKAQKSGAIVTFTSGLALVGWAGAGAYAASKAALIGLTKSLAHELREFGVRANVLSPGVTATPIFLDVATDEEVAMYENGIGVYSPESVVPTLLYLISDASRNMTGVVIEHRIRPAELGPAQKI